MSAPPLPRRAVVATHVYATGPAQELAGYLASRCEEVLFIGHPLFRGRQDRSTARLVRAGQTVQEWSGPAWGLPGPAWYALDPAWAVRRVLGLPGAFDLFVGANPLNAAAGLALRALGKVRRAVLYTIDYAPRRFPGAALNAAYHALDRLCVRSCDRTWNLSPRMAEARGQGGLSARYAPRQVVVPHGTPPAAPRRGPGEYQRHTLAFLGHLRPHHGLEDLVRMLPGLVAAEPRTRLLVLGDGPLLPALRELAAGLGLGDRVEFAGFVEDHDQVVDRLSRCGIGLAPYEAAPGSVTWLADPGKPKAYLAAGLPVAITRVPQVAEDIAAAGAGLAVPPSPQEFCEAVLRLLRDDALYAGCREQAAALARTFAWDAVFDRALSDLGT